MWIHGENMRIFASWSGPASKEIAELLKQWIPNVLQDVEVYVSSQDIGKGERWLSSVTTNLAEIDFGIVVITKSNMNAPWILFEAGALSKSVKGYVVPLLCGIDAIDAATSPLTQFQYIRAIRDEMKELLVQANSVCSKPLDNQRVVASFEKWWPDFEQVYKKIDLDDNKAIKKDKEDDSTRLGKIEEALGELMLETRRSRRQQNADLSSSVLSYLSKISLDEGQEEKDFNIIFHEDNLRKLRERDASHVRLRRGISPKNDGK